MRLIKAIVCCAVCLGAQTKAATAATTTDPTTASIVQQPRPFGYVLGDTLTQRILLQIAGRKFEPATLPPSERAGLWFARRSSRIEIAEDGRRWLVVDYQLINAPQALMTVNLPWITLKSKQGSQSDEAMLVVPEWPISIAPLTPRAAFAKGGLQELRPDHPAPMLPTAELRRQLALWSIAFAVIIAIWLGWWVVRHFRAAANQPFARALREIRRSADGSADAWLAMHRAFDRTAGRTVQLSTLPVLFKQAPHFEPQRSAIEQFYAESNRRFFKVATGSTDSSQAVAGVASSTAPTRPRAADADPATAGVGPRTLCTTLRKLEKQHER